MKEHILRLVPGQQLKMELINYCRENEIHSGFVTGCAGSLKQLRIRLANAENFREFDEELEIVSLQGSMCDDGVHLHISVANQKGDAFGGHLVEGTVNTTAEILLIESEAFTLGRKYDEATGYKELVIHRK
ncbi:MAG: DUF296 domain-containing protein [Erysipelotrichaceae bacterium]|nr:DUF296 domain-containing protein [Erysipelotrichaceae bacterium]